MIQAHLFSKLCLRTLWKAQAYLETLCDQNERCVVPPPPTLDSVFSVAMEAHVELPVPNHELDHIDLPPVPAPRTVRVAKKRAGPPSAAPKMKRPAAAPRMQRPAASASVHGPSEEGADHGPNANIADQPSEAGGGPASDHANIGEAAVPPALPHLSEGFLYYGCGKCRKKPTPKIGCAVCREKAHLNQSGYRRSAGGYIYRVQE